MKIKLTLNDETREVEIHPADILVDVLREKLSITGTHKVCGQGICGACTVLVGGKPVTSCLTLAAQMDGEEITTVEGLGSPGHLSPVQEAFMRHGAVQCGYCTPGFLMVAHAFIADNPTAGRGEIADALRGNICRCTGYVKILDAVEDAATVTTSNRQEVAD